MSHLPPATDPGADLEADHHPGTGDFAPGPDLDGDDHGYRDAVRNVIETALAATPKEARTVEAKAAHIHGHLTTHGWAVMDVSEGDVVHVGPDQQVVTVPDGFVVDVHPLATAGPDLGPLADPELATLADIVAQLEGLDPESRERVAAFVTHRYGPTGPPSPPPTWGQPWYRPVQQAPGQGFATGGVIGRPQATRISE